MIISIAINKGGVGKTSLVTNLAGAIIKDRTKKVLIIDADGQGNVALQFGLNPDNYEFTMYDVFIGSKNIKDIVIKINDNLDIAPANNDLNLLEFDILTKLDQYNKPLNLLQISNIKNDYDYILIDTPPSFGLIVSNILNVSDYVLIPFTPELNAVKGLIKILDTIEDFKKENNSNLKLLGVVGMMVENRTILHSEMLQKARSYADQKSIKIFDTIIPKSIRFANSVVYNNKPATMSENNVLVNSYFELLEEIQEAL